MSHETIHQPKTGFGERFTFRRSLSQPVLRSKEQKIADGMHHGLEIEICIGNEALTCLNDREFGLQWRSLYELCPWATVFQNPDFAMAWYEIYRERYIPVIVRGMTAENRLAGLLTLATTEDRRRLVAAGDIQAEYQCWLENPSGNNVFIRHALPKIREAFPGLGLSIKYLPANTPLDWIGDSHELGKVCFLKKHSRPLMKVDEKAILEKMKTKNNKKKFGKLKRFGEVQFECVTDHERLIRLFDEIPVQYDFRSHALHGISPFTSDPLKRPFHIELHRRGLLHTTILKAGGRIASTKSGLNGKGWVHDTLSTHSPVFGFGSPGTMHTFLLGLQLAREGVPIYDLTPGSAEFKEYFATDHDSVSVLHIYDNPASRLKKEVLFVARELIKKSMQRAGVKATSVWIMLGRWNMAKEIGLQRTVARLMREATARPMLYRYSSGNSGSRMRSIHVAKDSLADLCRIDSHDRGISRQEFLMTAMERLKALNHAYTYVRNGKLMLCRWVEGAQPFDTTRFSSLGGKGLQRSIILFDLYVHGQALEQELMQDFIEEVLADLDCLPDIDSIYLSGAFRHKEFRNIERCAS